MTAMAWLLLPSLEAGLLTGSREGGPRTLVLQNRSERLPKSSSFLRDCDEEQQELACAAATAAASAAPQPEPPLSAPPPLR